MSKHILAQAVCDSAGAEWTAKALTAAGSPYYTQAIKVEKSNGVSTIVVTTTGSVSIVLEVSIDGTTFYTPYDALGNDLGFVCSAITSTRWISIFNQLAKYIRFKVTAGGNITTTLKFLQQEES
jgi:hypothetical protein